MVYVANLALIIGYDLTLNMFKISEKRRRIIFLTLCVIQIAIIIGTRTIDTGIDTRNYYNYFERLRWVGSPLVALQLGGFEILYSLLTWVIAHLGGSFTTLNVIMAIITMIFLAKAIYKLSSSAFFSIYLFISFCLMYQMINQYRQILALSVALYAISCLLEGKKVKFTVFLLLAAGFHVSSFVIFPTIFLTDVKLSKRMVYLYILSGAGLWFFSDLLMYLLSFTPYADYIGSYYDQRLLLSTVLNFGVRFVVLVFCSVFYKRLKPMRLNVDFFYHMAFICTVLQFMTMKSALFGRVTTYYFAGYLVLIPEIVVNGCATFKNKILVNSSLFLVFMLWHYVYYMDSGFTYTSVLFS